MSWADWGTRNEVDASNVVDQYQYGSITFPTVGTNTALAESNDPPVRTGAWSRWLGYRRPALSATQAGVEVPGLGQGTAALAATTEIPCDPTPRRLTVACGQQKTHRVEGVVDENGAPIDTGDSALEYVVEDGTGRDFGTGSATMVDPGIFEFVTSDANRIPGSYRWAIRTEAPQNAVVVYGNVGDYVVLDIAKKDAPDDSTSVCVSVTSGGQALEGATVKVYEEITLETFVVSVVTGQDGRADISLPDGVYYAQPCLEGQDFGEPQRIELPV